MEVLDDPTRAFASSAFVCLEVLPKIGLQQTTSGDRFLPRVLLAAAFRSEAISEARPTFIEKREPHFVAR